jgi:hypothetical protein
MKTARQLPRQALYGRQRGIALPVMLIILAVLLVGSIYLLRNTHSSTIITGNLAYDATLSRQADRGLHLGFDWLRSTSAANKAALNVSNPAQGYVARLDTTQTPRDAEGAGFWAGSTIITDTANKTRTEYVIHRLCALEGPYDGSTNHCVQTTTNTGKLGNKVPFGQSTASDTSDYAGSPLLHYVITARISGPRGTSVTNQLIVQIGA